MRDLIGKRLQMAHGRGEALISKRRTARSIAEYEEQRRGLSKFVIVLVGIALPTPRKSLELRQASLLQVLGRRDQW